METVPYVFLVSTSRRHMKCSTVAQQRVSHLIPSDIHGVSHSVPLYNSYDSCQVLNLYNLYFTFPRITQNYGCENRSTNYIKYFQVCL